MQQTPMTPQLTALLNEPSVLEIANSANAVQIGGTHYQDGSARCPHCQKQIQHWDVVAMFKLNYFIGNATKYLFRMGLKGVALEQLDKAIHYLQKQRELIAQ